MKNFINEFKEFALKGNVFDMAIGVVIGGAFGNIVTSLVNDIIMPIVALLVGSADFSGLSAQIGTTAAGEPILLTYGAFIQYIVNFLIIAFSIFMVVKAINKFKRKEEEKPAEPAPTPEDIVLLTEIRDLLKKD